MFDPDTLEDLFRAAGDDPDVVADLVDRFIDEAPRQVEMVARALATDDAERLGDAARAAEALRQVSATLGAGDLAELARQLEVAVREPLWRPGSVPVEAAREAVAQVTGQLREARDAGWPPR